MGVLGESAAVHPPRDERWVRAKLTLEMSCSFVFFPSPEKEKIVPGDVLQGRRRKDVRSVTVGLFSLDVRFYVVGGGKNGGGVRGENSPGVQGGPSAGSALDLEHRSWELSRVLL